MTLKRLEVAGLCLAVGLFGGAAPAVHAVGVDIAPLPRDIPARPADAITGSEFARRTTGFPGPERQRAAVAELLAGNLPESLRSLRPIRLGEISGAGIESEIVIWVMPDYLAIGPDEDFLRIPLTYPSAVTVARRFGFVLPTRRIVDAIYEQSTVHLSPRPLPPGPRMRSSAYFLRHQQIIEEQLAGHPRGELVSGHKKDIVLTNRLRSKSDRIAIYGWHRLSGEAIQPLSTVHGARYADYSHGVRLIWATAWVDGAPRSLLELLADPMWAEALTYEGEIRRAAALMSWPPS